MVARQVGMRATAMKDRDGVAHPFKPTHEMRADEAGASDDQNLHFIRLHRPDPLGRFLFRSAPGSRLTAWAFYKIQVDGESPCRCSAPCPERSQPILSVNGPRPISESRTIGELSVNLRR